MLSGDNIKNIHNLQQLSAKYPTIKKILEKLSPTSQKLVVYNAHSAIVNLKNALGDKIDKIKESAFVGNKTGIGYKADIYVKYIDDTSQAFANASKIQNNENEFGISVKTRHGTGIWVGLQDSSPITFFSKICDIFDEETATKMFSNITDKEKIKKIHEIFKKINPDTLKQKIAKNLGKLYEDIRYPDNLYIMIQDFETNRTHIRNEKDIVKDLTEDLLKSKVEININSKRPEFISNINFRHPETNKLMFTLEPRSKRISISFRQHYSYLLSKIQSQKTS